MRDNQPVTQERYEFPDDQRLISSTDTSGNIKHCNNAFVEVSGFSRDELIDQPHNIVRHPDMPPAIYANMWSYLKAGEPWMGVVKNRRKNGDHYWVNAYVTPIRDGNTVVGFESVRTRPQEDDVKRAEALYKRMRKGKKPVSLMRRVRFALAQYGFGGLAMVAVLATWLLFGEHLAIFIAIAAMVALQVDGRMRNSRLVQRVLNRMEDNFQDATVALTYSDSMGSLSQLEVAITAMMARLRTVLTRIDDSAKEVRKQSEEALRLAESSSVSIDGLQAETSNIAAAMNQMSTNIHEVSGNVQDTANQADGSRQIAEEGAREVQLSRDGIRTLAKTMDTLDSTIKEVVSQTEAITNATVLIQNITEQTNLLALNAAIEAARAGEHGRGFSVVADEVRALASRTAQTTEDIRDIMTQLSERTSRAEQVSEEGRQASAEAVSRIENAAESLSKISEVVKDINSMTHQMAASVEEQSQVAEHINEQLSRVTELAGDSQEKGQQSNKGAVRMSELADNLHELVERFAI
ncbi:PAS domain-containing methyl-accepting chemotaxis protein [Saccharospirillum sp. HFRX-1]|uniref:methyl-accepting chemotaxis protein n=1 Tax=unclassified Saccharospirillum TaxID=2633430 RepID=UPI003718F3EF